jgi:hypothetical protein
VDAPGYIGYCDASKLVAGKFDIEMVSMLIQVAGNSDIEMVSMLIHYL